MTNEKKPVIEQPTVDTSGAEHPLSPIVQEEIGRRLRAVYGKLAAEPLPDKFVKLLQELAKADDDDETDSEVES
jgi:hypothetical protein